jgi:hypothetical protein
MMPYVSNDVNVGNDKRGQDENYVLESGVREVMYVKPAVIGLR